MTPRELLQAVRIQLASPAMWTQGTNARDVSQLPVGSVDPNATCWCLNGALLKCGGDEVEAIDRAAERLCDEAARRNYCGLVDFNDTPGRQHYQILELIDRALERTGR